MKSQKKYVEVSKLNGTVCFVEETNVILLLINGGPIASHYAVIENNVPLEVYNSFIKYLLKLEIAQQNSATLRCDYHSLKSIWEDYLNSQMDNKIYSEFAKTSPEGTVTPKAPKVKALADTNRNFSFFKLFSKTATLFSQLTLRFSFFR